MSDAYSSAKAEVPNYAKPDNTVWYYATSKIAYNKKGVISIRIKTSWYVGGTSDQLTYGLTYSLKTGKKLSLADVCNGSSKKIKENIYEKVTSSYSYSYIPTYYDMYN